MTRAEITIALSVDAIFRLFTSGEPLSEPTKITVIVPFSRAERAHAVFSNFARQRYPDKRLWVVCNRGADYALPADRVLTSGNGAGAARNEGVGELKRSGGGYFVMMDDDDWYGPAFLTEVAENTHRANVVGKAHHFVSYDDQHLFLFYPKRARSFCRWVTGGTIGAWSEDALAFPTGKSEDLYWCVAMVKAGAKLWNTSVHHYLHRRMSRVDHGHETGALSIDDFIYRVGGGEFLGPVDPEVVTGGVPPYRYPVRRHEGFATVLSKLAR